MGEKIKSLLLWAGTALTFVSSIVYIMIVYVLVKGFNNTIEQNKLLMFAAIGAIFGIVITMALYEQGAAFAREMQEYKDLKEEYNSFIVKQEKKLRSGSFYFIMEFLKTSLFKGLTVAVGTYYSISFILEGINDDKYILMALANVLLFVGFGLLSVSKGYDHQLRHNVWLRWKINQMINKPEEEQKTPRKGGKGNYVNDKEIVGDVGVGVQRSTGPGANQEDCDEEGTVERSDEGTGRHDDETPSIEGRLR